MKVRCSHCNAAFAVDDAKVTGKKFAFDCPKCGNNVVIDNRSRTHSTASESQKAVLSGTGLDNNPVSFSNNIAAGLDDESSVNFPPVEEMGGASLNQSGSIMDDDFEDEIEPEIDLSVLQNLAGANQKNSVSDDDLLSSDFSSDIVEEDLSYAGHTAPVEDITGSSEDDDESLTIDLDSLDIDLAETEEVSAGESPDLMLVGNDLEDSERLSLPIEAIEAETSTGIPSDDEDESLTLDLESLDIPLEESTEFKEGEKIDDLSSRLSLEDAGLSIDDVESSEVIVPFDEEITADLAGAETEFEEEKPFSSESIINEIDEFVSAERPLCDEFNDEPLPEIDIDRFGGTSHITENDYAGSPAAPAEDQFLDIESRKKYDQYENDLNSYNAETIAASGGGYINFSIDYSFHYSRLRAVLRILLVYYITYIPYYVIGVIYSLISGVVGSLNQLLVLFSGKRERDFSLMQEQTLRFTSSLYASVLNVIEEKPPFGGKSNIDHQLQFRVIYPPNYSRILAFLRLSVVGILLLSLPHLILLLVMTVGMSLISVVSLFYTVFTGRWPSLLFDFMVRYLRYWTTINAYMCGLIDTYPSFRFE